MATNLTNLMWTRRGLLGPNEQRKLRVRARLTQAEIAQVVGCSKTAVSSWERGTSHPSPEFIDKYADILARIMNTLEDMGERV